MLVVVGDEANLAKLARYKEITGKLADPRKLDDSAAQLLIAEGKVFYWAVIKTAFIHRFLYLLQTNALYL